MKTIVPTFIALVMLSCASGEHPTAHRLGYRHPPGNNPNNYTMILDGVDYADRNAFTTAVAKLPPRSQLVWSSGCIVFDEIPLGSAPRLTISAFKAFCHSHHIRFDYYCGMAPNPLITRTFVVSQPLPATDARKWLEARGVQFVPEGSAHWNTTNPSLTAHNTEDQLNLIALILEHINSKGP